MERSPTQLVIARVLIAVLVAGIIALGVMVRPVWPAERTHAFALPAESRIALAEVRAAAETSAPMMFLARTGKNAALAHALLAIHAKIRVRDDGIDYIRARVPIAAVDAALRLPQLVSVAVDAIDHPQARPGTFAADVDPSAFPVLPDDYPLRHPFSPLGDLDASDVRRTHPTYDGRGITVAMVDGNFDFLMPEMRYGTDINGKTVNKIAHYRNSLDPLEDDYPQWVRMDHAIDATGTTAVFGGKRFILPAPGRYRIGFFNERKFGGDNVAYLHGDIDRDGNPPGDDGLFGVLWDETSGRVWVDVDRTLDFTKHPPLRDFEVAQETGVFGHPTPGSPIAHTTVGFAVQVDAADKFVAINAGVYQHATEVLPALGANVGAEGRFEGVAPGVRYASVTYGAGSMHSYIDAMRYVFEEPSIDAIVWESTSYVEDPHGRKDGLMLSTLALERLVQKYHKPTVVTGGNAPGLNQVIEDCAAPDVLCIGGYQSKESYRRNFGADVLENDNLHWGGLSHGPSGLGALKPDVIAPSGHMGNDVGYRLPDFQLTNLYKLPSGYEIAGGTSQATPTAGGAVVLLMSAAKQAGIPYDAERVNAAIRYSARYLPKYPAYEQGNGLIDVGRAWDLLQAYAKTVPPQIESRGTVVMQTDTSIAKPIPGVSLFEREGWHAGQRGTRTIVLRRTTGIAGPQHFDVHLVGSDGTFSVPASVTLPLGTAVPIAVGVNAQNAGAHSALLSLDADGVAGHAFRGLLTIVAAEPLAPHAVFKRTITVPNPGDGSVFVDVPANAGALHVTLHSGDESKIRPIAISPTNKMIYSPDSGVDVTMDVPHPVPGVWEIVTANNNLGFAYDPAAPRPLLPTAVTYTMSLIGTTAVRQNETLRVKNAFGPFSGAITSSSLVSGVHESSRIAGGHQRLVWLKVPKGATALVARLTFDPARAIDLDFLDRTPEGLKPNELTPLLPAQSNGAMKTRYLRIDKPHAGRWAIALDTMGTPDMAATPYTLDVGFESQANGSSSVDDVSALHPADSQWEMHEHTWMSKRAAGGGAIIPWLTLGAGESGVPAIDY